MKQFTDVTGLRVSVENVRLRISLVLKNVTNRLSPKLAGVMVWFIFYLKDQSCLLSMVKYEGD